MFDLAVFLYGFCYFDAICTKAIEMCCNEPQHSQISHSMPYLSALQTDFEPVWHLRSAE